MKPVNKIIIDKRENYGVRKIDMKPKSVLIINEGYSDNLGDQAINDSLQYLLKVNDIQNAKFQDYTKNLNGPLRIPCGKNEEIKKQTLLNKAIRLLPVKIRWLILNFPRVLIASKSQYDLIIIGGGQLVLSNATFAIAMFTWVSCLKIFGNKNVVICGVGLGSEFTFIDRILFKYSLNSARDIYLRDDRSQEVLFAQFGMKSKFIYDVAFVHNKILYNIKEKEQNKALLGVTSYAVYRKYAEGDKLSKDEFYDTWVTLLSKSSVPLNEVELFYTTKEDRSASIEFQEYIKRIYNVSLKLIETNNLELLISEVNSSQLVISARMHALILAFTYHRNIICYPISEKLFEFNRMIEGTHTLVEIQSVIEKNFSSLLKGK
ncbi:MAG: polysaccharide pyruvyl transferase WcaK-like protein [Alteromonadaceae bacterium]|jgi:polysaccharide pyruvyl transferase WcaK-like protein